jgi:DNA-binding MarR family transcriptional regulator
MTAHTTSSAGLEDSGLEDLDDVVHQRVRLGILTVVHEAPRVEFGFMQASLGLTGGNLSQHLRVLENAGLVEIEKGTAGRRPRTWISITRRGRRALLQEVTALKAIVARIEGQHSPRSRQK